MGHKSVLRSFDRGALRYDELATVQHGIVDDLLSRVQPQLKTAKNIVDLGCGTGRMLLKCREANANASLTGVDISSEMLDQANARIRDASLINCRLENTSLLESSYELVLSSSAMQWCDLALALQESARLVSSSGHVAIACLLNGTLASWRDDWGGQHQQLPNCVELVGAVEHAGLHLVSVDTELMVKRYDGFASALASVKGIGAGGNGAKSREFVGKKKVNSVREKINTLASEEGGYPMEYRVAYLIADKAGGK